MRTLLSSALALIILGGLAVAAVGPSWPVPQLPLLPAQTDSGGPDLYGYRYKTSTDVGGPSTNFIDISTIGTEVTGLADDNYVGPFPLGITFQYYWYEVTEMWIGSNGYIEFSQPSVVAAQPFDSIPSPLLPNDFVAPYMADYDLTTGGHVYRWTNNVDTTIVEWKAVPGWNTGGDHTFEVILAKTDSSITFQYGVQHGLLSNSSIRTGIENVSGLIGLQYWNFSLYLPTNYAMKFYYPSQVTYQAHDLGIIEAVNPGAKGFFLTAGSSFTPTGTIKNIGNQNESSFTARFVILKDSLTGDVLYDQTINGGALAIGQQQNLTFEPAWTATPAGQYAMRLSISLSGDVNPYNDTLVTECHVVTLPNQLLYDNGASNSSGWSWDGGNGGMANHFVPPVTPATLDSILFYTIAGSSGNPSPFTGKVFLDDGPNGMPGTEVFTTSINTPTPNTWYKAFANVPIWGGGFYVAWIMGDSTSKPLGVDASAVQPKSRQGWEFTGAWAPFRNGETSDLMIRARVHAGTAGVIDPGSNPTVPSHYALGEAHPNPFNPSTTISYSLPAAGDVSLVVYDQEGRQVIRLVSGWRPAGTYQVVFDGSSLTSGVYLVQMKAGNFSETHKIVMLK